MNTAIFADWTVRPERKKYENYQTTFRHYLSPGRDFITSNRSPCKNYEISFLCMNRCSASHSITHLNNRILFNGFYWNLQETIGALQRLLKRT